MCSHFIWIICLPARSFIRSFIYGIWQGNSSRKSEWVCALYSIFKFLVVGHSYRLLHSHYVPINILSISCTFTFFRLYNTYIDSMYVMVCPSTIYVNERVMSRYTYAVSFIIKLVQDEKCLFEPTKKYIHKVNVIRAK